MYSDESGHGKSEFYYPEEETLNQMTPINFFSKKNKYFFTELQVGPYGKKLCLSGRTQDLTQVVNKNIGMHVHFASSCKGFVTTNH